MAYQDVPTASSDGTPPQSIARPEPGSVHVSVTHAAALLWGVCATGAVTALCGAPGAAVIVLLLPLAAAGAVLWRLARPLRNLHLALASPFGENDDCAVSLRSLSISQPLASTVPTGSPPRPEISRWRARAAAWRKVVQGLCAALAARQVYFAELGHLACAADDAVGLLREWRAFVPDDMQHHHVSVPGIDPEESVMETGARELTESPVIGLLEVEAEGRCATSCTDQEAEPVPDEPWAVNVLESEGEDDEEGVFGFASGVSVTSSFSAPSVHSPGTRRALLSAIGGLLGEKQQRGSAAMLRSPRRGKQVQSPGASEMAADAHAFLGGTGRGVRSSESNLGQSTMESEAGPPTIQRASVSKVSRSTRSSGQRSRARPQLQRLSPTHSAASPRSLRRSQPSEESLPHVESPATDVDLVRTPTQILVGDDSPRFAAASPRGDPQGSGDPSPLRVRTEATAPRTDAASPRVRTEATAPRTDAASPRQSWQDASPRESRAVRITVESPQSDQSPYSFRPSREQTKGTSDNELGFSITAPPTLPSGHIGLRGASVDLSATARRLNAARQAGAVQRLRRGTVLCVEVVEDHTTANLNDTQRHRVSSASSAVCKGALECGIEHDGHLLDCQGSRLLQAWNSIRPQPQHAQLAARCAIQMRGYCARSCDAARTCSPPWWGAGVCSGTLLLGVVTAGNPPCRRPVVFGSAVADGCSLAQLTRRLRAQTVTDDRTHDLFRGAVRTRPVDAVRLATSCSTDVVSVIFELLSEYAPRVDSAWYHAFSDLRQLRAEEAVVQFRALLAARKQGDPQPRRLMRIAQLLRLKPGRTGTRTYFRTQIGCGGWEDLEEEAAEAAMQGDPEGGDDGSPQGGGAHAWASPTGGPEERQLQKGLSSARLRVLIQDGGAPGSPHRAGLPGKFTTSRGLTFSLSSRMLGKGAFAEVWLGMSAQGSLVAVKALPLPTPPPPTAADSAPVNTAARRRQKRMQCASAAAGALDELLHEVNLLQSLENDNIVRYIGSAVKSGQVLIVTEYLAGGSLQTVQGTFVTLPMECVQRNALDVARGLHFLHSHNIVHRDMKPGNVLLTAEGLAKLADFGASALLQQNMLAASFRGPPVAVGVIGTPAYMAPEACRGRAEAASDVWSVGIMLCELITGKLPWENPPQLPSAWIYQVGSADPPMRPVVPAGIPADARQLIVQCLQERPSARPTPELMLTSPFLMSDSFERDTTT